MQFRLMASCRGATTPRPRDTKVCERTDVIWEPGGDGELGARNDLVVCQHPRTWSDEALTLHTDALTRREPEPGVSRPMVPMHQSYLHMNPRWSR
jgi:hypothetical protein